MNHHFWGLRAPKSWTLKGLLLRTGVNGVKHCQESRQLPSWRRRSSWLGYGVTNWLDSWRHKSCCLVWYLESNRLKCWRQRHRCPKFWCIESSWLNFWRQRSRRQHFWLQEFSRLESWRERSSLLDCLLLSRIQLTQSEISLRVEDCVFGGGMGWGRDQYRSRPGALWGGRC